MQRTQKQTYVDAVVGYSVFVSPYESRLVDSVGFVHLGIFNPSSSYKPSSPSSSSDFTESCVMFGHESRHLFPSATGGSLSEDYWARHQSMMIADYH